MRSCPLFSQICPPITTKMSPAGPRTSPSLRRTPRRTTPGDAPGVRPKAPTSSVTCMTSSSGKKAQFSTSTKMTKVAAISYLLSAVSASTARKAKNCAKMPRVGRSMGGPRSTTSSSPCSPHASRCTCHVSTRPSSTTTTSMRTSTR